MYLEQATIKYKIIYIIIYIIYIKSGGDCFVNFFIANTLVNIPFLLPWSSQLMNFSISQSIESSSFPISSLRISNLLWWHIFFLLFKTFIPIPSYKFFFFDNKNDFIRGNFPALNYEKFIIRYRRIINKISTWYFIWHTWID